MDGKAKISVSLNIYGFSDGDDISTLLGRKPDRIADTQGSKPSHWELRAKPQARDSIEEHLSWLIHELSGYEEAITKIARNYDTNISIGVTYRDFNPEIILEPDMLQAISKLNVKLWFDLYFLTEG